MPENVFANKFILLDTNVLISMIKYPIFFTRYFHRFRTLNMSPYITDGISFEFLRYSKTKSEFNRKESWLLNNDITVIHSHLEDVKVATLLSSIYTNKHATDIKQVSFIDALNFSFCSRTAFLSLSLRPFRQSASQECFALVHFFSGDAASSLANSGADRFSDVIKVIPANAINNLLIILPSKV